MGSAPADLPRSWLRRADPGRLLLEAAFIVSAYALYLLVRGAVAGHEGEAFANAERVIQAEQWLGIFWEPDLQAAILRRDAWEWLAETVYIWGHLPAIIAIAVWIYAFHRPQYALYRNAFLLSGAVGLLVFWLMPTAPPRLLQDWGFTGTSPGSVSYYIWQPPALVNQYAAMPSLHFGWNVLGAIAIVTNAQSRWRYMAVLMPEAVGSAAVFSANHFFLDLAAGGAVAPLSLWLAARLRASLPLGAITSALT
jgi:hypothetical protein